MDEAQLLFGGCFGHDHLAALTQLARDAFPQQRVLRHGKTMARRQRVGEVVAVIDFHSAFELSRAGSGASGRTCSPRATGASIWSTGA